MDRINEMITWITLAASWWLYKREFKNGDKGEPEKALAVVNVVPNGLQPLTCGQFQSVRLHGDSIISTGLSDLMRKKSRLNKGRRIEDRQPAE